MPSEGPGEGRRLEDIFSGHVELTATERGYVLAMLDEAYLSDQPPTPAAEPDRRSFHGRIVRKLIGALRLERMVTPDGSRLVSVEEHAQLVASLDVGRAGRTEGAR